MFAGDFDTLVFKGSHTWQVYAALKLCLCLFQCCQNSTLLVELSDIMQCKLTALDSKWVGRDLIRHERAERFLSLLFMGADRGVAASPPSPPVLFADWFHGPVSHGAHHHTVYLPWLGSLITALFSQPQRRPINARSYLRPSTLSTRSTSALQLFL